VIPAAFTGFLMQRVPSKALPSGALAVFALAAYMLGLEHGTEQLALAGLAVAIAFVVVVPSTGFTGFLASISLGIYLIHPAIIAIALGFLSFGSWSLFLVVSAATIGITIVTKKSLPSAI